MAALKVADDAVVFNSNISTGSDFNPILIRSTAAAVDQVQMLQWRGLASASCSPTSLQEANVTKSNQTE